MTPKEIRIWKRRDKQLLKLNDYYTTYLFLNEFKSISDIENYKKKLLIKLGY